jgi:xanthine dehydrogenase accessory factor
MSEDILGLAVELRGRQEAFVLATVVRCERPTSAKPGAKAIVRSDGSVSGWVGGACAEPVVVRESLMALRDAEPRLIALTADGTLVPGRTEGVAAYAMTCHSGGTLEIYVEPFLPRPLLVLVGHGPVIDSLAALGRATDFRVAVIPVQSIADGLPAVGLGSHASVVVATHGSADEDALRLVLEQGASYVSLVASRKRAASVVDSLRARGVAQSRIDRLKAPAGLDIGAVTPEEIAVSILAEIVQTRRAEKSPALDPLQQGAATSERERLDPVCGMFVEVASAVHRAEVAGHAFYFCCAGCKEAFLRDPRRYAADLAE